jgi:hypothetical protein
LDHCDIDGVVAVLNDKVIKTTPIEMELQVIGQEYLFIVQ